ncbi:MAG: manganese efflux pump MntP family protein [Lachnospiraceae bacterium]
MEWSFLFFVNSVLLGVGLAMDAFSVSLANGLHEPDMKKNKMSGIAGTFAFFQAAMPMIGWICVHTIIQLFAAFEKLIPWIALLLLLFIGGKMLLEGMKNDNVENENTKVGFTALLIQGIATSIDALSVGFTIAEYGFLMALVCALIIAVVTFVICIIGLILGKKFGTRFGNKATIIGGIILIFIGIEIFVKGVFL